MDQVVFSIPIPKTFKQTTRNDRIQIQTLYYHAGFTIDQIILQLYPLTKHQIEYALSHPLTPKKKGLWSQTLSKHSMTQIPNSLGLHFKD